MRHALHLLLAAILTVSLAACDTFTSQSILDDIAAPDDPAMSDSVRQQYQDDAAQLAVRFVQQRALEDDSVTLPDDRVQLFYNALVHVYAAEQVEGHHEITSIHTFPHYNTHEIIVAVDTTVGWTEAWQAGERLTGQSDVDALLEAYDLSVEYKAGPSHALVRSETPINPVAMSQQFEGIAGVEYAEQNGYGGDGNDIEATVDETSVLLTYSRGSGDCPSGCIHRATWTYRVDEDGSVDFVGHEEQ